MSRLKLMSMAGIASMFGLNSMFKIPKVPMINYKKGHGNGRAFTKGKRSKSLKVRSNRMKAKRKNKCLTK